MDNQKVQETVDKRFTLDRQIQDLLNSAFEDYGMNGMAYVANEVNRIVNSLQKEVELDQIIEKE